ncbi:MAG: response regulator [Thermodesulfobacteriota bacterium]
MDDELGLKVLLRYLLEERHELLSAEDGHSGVELAMARRPKLILMDVKMPGMNGWEAVRAIRSKGARIPIIVMTGFPDPSHQDLMMDLGVRDYVVKPFDLKEFQELASKRVQGQV